MLKLGRGATYPADEKFPSHSGMTWRRYLFWVWRVWKGTRMDWVSVGLLLGDS
jgi:hypothetical protein